MHLRIKYLRKTLRLSQHDFGEKLEVSRDVINNIERNRNKNPISEYIIARICKVFGANETWLRTGNGDMFAEQKNSSVLNELQDEYNLSKEELKFLEGYLGLPENDRKQFVDTIHTLIKNTGKEKRTTTNNISIVKSNNATDKMVKVPIYTPTAAGFGHYADNEIIGYESLPAEWIDNPEDYCVVRVDGDSMSPRFEDNDLLLVKRQDSIDSGTIAVVLVDNETSFVKKVVYDTEWIELISINPNYNPIRFEGKDVERVRIFGTVEKLIGRDA